MQSTPQNSNTKDDVAHRLAAYASALRYSDLDPATVEAVKVRVVDAIGCAIAAHDEPMVQKCRALSAAFAGGCTVIGTRQRTTMDFAAFVNGAAIRYLDMNDTYLGAGDPGHPSDNLSACLAAAETQHASGEALIVSIALAYEVNCRLLEGSRLIPNGWDYTLQTLPASALASGKLLGLSAEQLAQAINISLVANIPTFQTRVQTLSDWKGLANAQSTRNGVFAALLAQQGITGPAPIFEGTHGVFRQLGAEYEVAIEEFGGRGGTFQIHRTSLKRYPSEFFSLTAIQAAIDLAEQVGDIEGVREIQVDTTRLGHYFLGSEPEKWHPKTRDAADHSLPYMVARAMLDGTITRESCSPAAIEDPRLQRLMAKVTVREAAELTAKYPADVPNRLTVTLADGRKLVQQVDSLPGFAGRAMSRADVEAKFKANVGKHWSADRISTVLDVLWRLDEMKDVSELFGHFTIGT
jgi:2-methylcitrate dehydratase